MVKALTRLIHRAVGTFWQCKKCPFCSASCESGIPGDAQLKGCSSICDAQQRNLFCPLCKCRGCYFCNGDGTGSSITLPPGNYSGPCFPLNGAEIDQPKCLGHCSENSRATHCEDCHCQVPDRVLKIKSFCHCFIFS